jgi:hypothetical protein
VVVGLSLGLTLVVSMCAAIRIRVGVVGRVASVGGPVSVVGADVSVCTKSTMGAVDTVGLGLCLGLSLGGGKRRGKQTDLKFSKRVNNFILLSQCCYH